MGTSTKHRSKKDGGLAFSALSKENRLRAGGGRWHSAARPSRRKGQYLMSRKMCCISRKGGRKPQKNTLI